MYPSRQAQGHRTGYTGDLTERSASGPLDALTDTSSMSSTSAKSRGGRWPDGSTLTTRLMLNDSVPLTSFAADRRVPLRCCFASTAGEQPPGVERLTAHRDVPQRQPEP